MKTKPTATSAARVTDAIRFAPNPLPQLTPKNLAAYLDSFARGYLRDTAILWDAIERRDDRVLADSVKRRKSIGRYGYRVVACDGQDPRDPKVARHIAAIKFALENLTARDALDGSVVGGMSTLIRQMMCAVGFGWQVNEVVWRKTPNGLTCDTIAMPLWWFERLTGCLRYLPADLAIEGVPLEDDGWLVTKGDCLMAPTSVLYLLKRMALTDWSLYNGRVGPGIHGTTSAARGSADWTALEDAVENFSFDLSMVTGSGVKIEPIEMALKGTLPWPGMYEAMTKAITVLWRGGNLMTDSSGGPDQSGVTLQGSEASLLEQDDAEMVSDAINDGIVEPLILYRFGEAPLAWVEWNTGTKPNAANEIAKDDALARRGWQFTVEDLAERYDRTPPQPGQTILVPPAPAAAPFAAANARAGTGEPLSAILGDHTEARLRDAARRHLAQAMDSDLAPLRQRIEAALALDDDAAMLQALSALRDDLPDMLARMSADPASQEAIEQAITAALLNGLAEGVAARRGGQ